MRKALLAMGAIALACGTQAPPATDAGPQDAGMADAGESPDAGASPDAGPTQDAGPLPDAGPLADSGVPDAGGMAPDSGIGIGDGGAITGLPAEAWAWIPFPQSTCRDGSSTGIGINLNPASTQVMIFLQEGGACFNSITCAENAANFGEIDFGQVPYLGSTPQGVFDRTDPANPVKDWSWVFVPYCTGDVHLGGNPAGQVPGVGGTQQFVGYANLALYLQRLVPTFAGATHVLLSGASAGGFGAAGNYAQVARAFAGVPVDLLDDSGPFMEDPYLADCLQSGLRTLFGLDQTIIADCGSACADAGNFFLAGVEQEVQSNPDRRFGLVDSTGDQVITEFFGFGASDCTSFAPLSAQTFTAGLQDIRTQLSSDSNFGLYIFDGTDHTSITTSPEFDERTAAGVTLTSWITELLDGGVSNPGP